MAKLMSDREMALFIVAMNYCHAYQECMGNAGSIEETAHKVANAAGGVWDKHDISECCEHIMVD